MEGLINWFTRNHVAANFLMIFVLILGMQTWMGLKKEIFPETSIESIAVKVPFPNATPDEVEKGVIVPIEEAVQDLDGIDRIKSTAVQSQGVVLIEVKTGYDTREVMDDVKTRIDAIQNLSEEAEEPVLEEIILKNQVMSIAVSADTDEKSLRSLVERVRDDLLAYSDGPVQVTQAEMAGTREYEISIEISEDTLRQYGLTFDQLAAAVRRSSLDLPGGSVRTTGGEVMIRTEARRYTADQFAPITVVTEADGSEVKLRDIALIRDEFEEDDVESRFDGRPAMLINVFRVGSEDTLEIAETVRKFVYEEAPRTLPGHVKLEIWRDDSTYLDGRMKLLTKNGVFGLILVAIVLALFLRPSLALLVAIGIPVSFAGAIATIPFVGISINMISLFAFILVLGIVVDDAIVVGENVYRRMRNGEHPKTAAPRGTHEVGVVVTFGVLTTAMAFTPMLGLTGVSGKIWPNIPLIVIPTLLFSLVQSKLILPSHLALLKPYDPDEKPGPILRFQRIFSRGLETFVDRFYRPFLNIVLKNRYVVLAVFVSILVSVMSLVISGHIKSEFFPQVEGDIASAKLKMPKGSPFEATQRGINQLEEASKKLNEFYAGDDDSPPIIRHTLASAGTQPFQIGFDAVSGIPRASNLGEVTLELQPSTMRAASGEEIVSKWRELAGDIPGAVELSFRSESAAGGNAIDLELTGPDLVDLEKATEEIKAAMAEFDGVIDISDSNLAGNRELKLAITPVGESLGLRLDDVARQVRQGFYGDEIQRLQRDRNEVKVFVRYPREERRSFGDIGQMKIRTPRGDEVPFHEVATVSFGRSYSTIERTARQRMIRITGDVDKAKGTNANEVVASLVQEPETHGQEWWRNLKNFFRNLAGKDPLPAPATGGLVEIVQGYQGMRFSFEGEQKDQRESVSQMGRKFILALMAMYVLMAIPLRSYIQPMIVMSVIPFGLVGAILGHIAMGFVLSIMSMCGIVALAGVVVNDSLVLVDYVNRHRGDAGKTMIQAVTEAGAMRFRPIILTSLTTFAGLTPMLLETDIQARFLIPMAVSLSFGILFATAITLLLVPCIYMVLEDVKGRFKKKAES